MHADHLSREAALDPTTVHLPAPDRWSAPTNSRVGTVASMLALQHLAGNRAVSQQLEPSKHGPLGETVQRQQVPPAVPRSAAELDADYKAALERQPPDWVKAGEILNGFNTPDIKSRVDIRPAADRRALRLALPEWNSRVRAACLDADYLEDVGKTDWVNAAISLNGFDTADIDERLAALPPGQAGDIATGARTGIPEGVSRQRILDAVQRLQNKVDASGGGGALGTSVIADVARMKDQGVGIDVARATAFGRLGLRVDTEGGNAPRADRGAAIVRIAAAMAATRVEPGMLSEGKVAHTEISLYYASLNGGVPRVLIDPTVVAVIRNLRLTKAAYDALYKRLPDELLESLKIRPDIVDLGKLQVYEIKSVDSAARAVPEMEDYIELLESFKLKDVLFHPGSPSNPGTRGFLPVPQGWVVFACVVPGAIIYRTILQVENPRAAQERLEGELLGAQNMMVGVESVTAIALTLAAGFEELLPLLIAGATKAGQAIPQIAHGIPQVAH